MAVPDKAPTATAFAIGFQFVITLVANQKVADLAVVVVDKSR
jgi:hypothetical protein